MGIDLMRGTSADESFAIIARQKLSLPESVLDAAWTEVALREGRGQVVSLSDVLVADGHVTPAQRDEIDRVCARHARACTACQHRTFLLLGEDVATKRCEHCGGKLAPPAGATSSTGRIPIVSVAPAPVVAVVSPSAVTVAAPLVAPAPPGAWPPAVVGPAAQAPTVLEPGPATTRKTTSTRRALLEEAVAYSPPPRVEAPIAQPVAPPPLFIPPELQVSKNEALHVAQAPVMTLKERLLWLTEGDARPKVIGAAIVAFALFFIILRQEMKHWSVDDMIEIECGKNSHLPTSLPLYFEKVGFPGVKPEHIECKAIPAGLAINAHVTIRSPEAGLYHYYRTVVQIKDRPISACGFELADRDDIVEAGTARKLARWLGLLVFGGIALVLGIRAWTSE